MIKQPYEIVSDEEVERIHANANFGAMSKRDVLNEGVWHAACGYNMGYTMATIIVEHGLAKWRRDRHKPLLLTAKGRRYLGAALSKAQINWKST